MKQYKYRQEFLVQWNARLRSDVTEPLVDKVVEAVLYNQGIPFEHTSEYRNIYSYTKLWEQLKHYEPERYPNVRNEHLRAGLSRAFKCFARPINSEPLNPVNLMTGAAQLFDELQIKSTTSAGLTAYGENKLEAFTTGLDKAFRIVEDGKSPSPCLAGVRTQRKGKTRLVWGYPLEMTIIEATVARPIINMFKGRDHLMTFGRTSHEVGMRLRHSCATTKFHTSIDYSQFDASIPPFMIRHAFSALKTWFRASDVVIGDKTVDDVFNVIESYFIHTPIVMPSEHRYPTLVLGKNGGVPSGSYFTQIVDSFVNAALIFSVADRFKITILDENLYVLGDDCLFFTNQEIGLDKIGNFVATFGFKCNPAKGSAGLVNQSIEYLGRKWKNGFPLRPYSDAIRGALYPEKFRRYSDQAGIRQMEALNVLNSYLLTSYIEDAPIGVDRFSRVLMVSERYSSGLTKFLMSEGLIPGKVFRRAIF